MGGIGKTSPKLNLEHQNKDIDPSAADADSQLAPFNIDTTAAFTTDTVFSTREAVEEWAKAVGISIGVVVIKVRSDKAGKRGSIDKIDFGCEKQGRFTNDSRVFGSKRRSCPFSRKALTIESYRRQPESKWFDLPEMGYMVATKYNVALVQFSLTMNFTYLPLRGTYGLSKFKIISVMNKQNLHWLHLLIFPTCPLSPIAPQWYQHYSSESASWLDPYAGRFTLWQSMCPSVQPPTPGDAPRCVDLADDSIDDL